VVLLHTLARKAKRGVAWHSARLLTLRTGPSVVGLHTKNSMQYSRLPLGPSFKSSITSCPTGKRNANRPHATRVAWTRACEDDGVSSPAPPCAGKPTKNATAAHTRSTPNAGHRSETHFQRYEVPNVGGHRVVEVLCGRIQVDDVHPAPHAFAVHVQLAAVC
jgi:hypothetical protein